MTQILLYLNGYSNDCQFLVKQMVTAVFLVVRDGSGVSNE